MELYHYMSAKYAIVALQTRRLKIAELEDMNDPFELRGIKFHGNEYTVDVSGFRSERSKWGGFLCFSATPTDLLMWSHYADRHRGICIGFNVSTTDDRFTKVAYRDRIEPAPLLEDLTEQKMRHLLCTKSLHWQYEKEWRAFPSLDDPEWNEELQRPLQFVHFGDFLVVSQILIGVRCSPEDEASVSALSNGVRVKRLMLSPDKFMLIR